MIPRPPGIIKFNKEKAEFIRSFILCRSAKVTSELRAIAEIEIAENAWNEINEVCKIKPKGD